MKVILKDNVHEAAVKHINFLFDEFENILVNFSGGKDSQTLLDICLKISRERNRDIHVFFLDAEFEFDATVQVVRKALNQKNVIPHWLQAPVKLNTSLSSGVTSWEIGKEWMREKEPNSMHFNIFRKENKDNVWFRLICEFLFGNEPYASISGIKCEESFNRFRALTMSETYKGLTWGKINDKEKRQFVFYPLYDWETPDIWKYILENKIEYNKVYDYKFRALAPEKKMRVGGLIGEAGLYDLSLMEEFEPETYQSIIKRIPSLHYIRSETPELTGLPIYFKTWEDYFFYLSFHKIVEEEIEKIVAKKVDKDEEYYEQTCYNILTSI